MVTVFPLASGSSGNSFYVSSGEGQGGLLIDAGISSRRIQKALCEGGIDPASLRGILVTHDHVDHVCGLRVLAKQLRIPVYASAITAERLSTQVEGGTVLRVLEAQTELAGFGVSSFATQHDATGSLGFRLESDSRTIGFATDLGTITPVVWQNLLGSHLIVLESNYDEHMLYACGYPYPLKQRIQSAYGHLSNCEAAENIAALTLRGTSRFILAHLSRESNTPELARQTVAERLGRESLREDCDYRLVVARRDIPTAPIHF